MFKLLYYTMFGLITSFLAVFNDVAVQAPSSNPLWGEPLQGTCAVRYVMHRQTRWLTSRGLRGSRKRAIQDNQ